MPEWMAESLDYVIPLNERHLRRLIRDYVGYYHLDRTHDAVGKDAPRFNVPLRRTLATERRSLFRSLG